MKMNKIFISYSHKDEKWKNRLAKQLNVLQMQAELDVWDDRRIRAGDDWYDEIKKAINDADAAVLMISADFLTSDFILKEEVPVLLQRRSKEGMNVFPLIVRPSRIKICPTPYRRWNRSLPPWPTAGLRKSGQQQYLPPGLFARAACAKPKEKKKRPRTISASPKS